MSVRRAEENHNLIDTYKLHEKDRGSSEIQIAILTDRINHLVEHLKQHKKDHHTRRGLIILVGRRRKLMKYLQRKNPDSFEALAKKLNLKVKAQ